MASKTKGIRLGQKDAWQKKLDKRLAELAAKGIEGAALARDAVVRALKAKVKEAEGRLAAIGAKEKKTADKKETKARKLAEAKAEKKEEAPPPAEEKPAKGKKKTEKAADQKAPAAKEKKPKAKKE